MPGNHVRIRFGWLVVLLSLPAAATLESTPHPHGAAMILASTASPGLPSTQVTTTDNRPNPLHHRSPGWTNRVPTS